jgi:hypothetical protein
MRGMRVGALLSLLTLPLGFSLGAIFGLFEDALKGGFEKTALQTFEAEADPQAAAARLAGRSWSYLKRSHLHANGLGTSALAMILLSAGMTSGAGWKRLTAYLLGIGALGYSTFWMLAAFRAPALGGTDLAKESLSWLAMPTAVCCLVGLALVLTMVVNTLFRRA